MSSMIPISGEKCNGKFGRDALRQTKRLPLMKGGCEAGGAGVNDMPVACQSCAPNARRHLARRRLAPHHTAGYAGRAFLTRPAERFECSGFENLSVICFANATVSLRLGHGAGLTAHRAVIQHRAAALPCTGEASRCGGDSPQTARERRQPSLGRGGLKSIRRQSRGRGGASQYSGPARSRSRAWYRRRSF